MDDYEQAIVELQRAALNVLEHLPPEKRNDKSWTTPLIVASLNGEPVAENFVAKVERWPADK